MKYIEKYDLDVVFHMLFGKQKNERIAKKLKNINIPIDKIIEVTGLTKEKIEKL